MHHLLVHGAWHGAWCFDGLIDALDDRGLAATAVDLPGHGDDPTPLSAVTLDAYVERIRLAVTELDRPVTLVGHSMGGMVISAAAEQMPTQVQALVYLCAFLPRSGESLSGLGREDTDTRLGAILSPTAEGNALRVDPEGARDVFYHDCPPDAVDAAIARLCPQATAPLTAPVNLTEAAFGSVPRRYVLCSRDRAVTPAMQRRMIERVGVERVLELDSGHSPFLSMPDHLAGALADLGRPV